jgi:Ser-tRNA(Ala) deacylase AlaX
MSTELLYMKDMEQTQCSAKIVDSQQSESKTVLILDQTIFHPQGGGQPYDTGIIKGIDGFFVFQVQEVRFIDGVVHHIGTIENGQLSVSVEVNCFIDEERRKLNSRLHSAGHLMDMALKELNIDWISGKGYHFPQGAYVEYSGKLDGLDVESLKLKIEEKFNEIISRNIETKLVFDNQKLQNGKPRRTVFYGEYGIPCGGTHVSNLNKIIAIVIRKIKKEKDSIRISYSI